MCGLTGGSGTFDVERALDLIAHRGPDGRDYAEVGGFTFGHVRLAIQDTTDAAAQPFRRGSVTLTYNGEIWNAEQLRAELPGPWTSTGDTEVVAALLDRDGWAGLSKLEGMFALAWNDSRGSWLARDRFGKVPLYAQRGGGWRWASEIKGLPSGVPCEPIPPGNVVNLDTGWMSAWATDDPGLSPTPERVRELLRQGVRDRLVSDRPVCFLLSGGLDSTFVLSLARELHEFPVAYTAVLDPDSEDLRAARRAALELEVPLVEVKVPTPTPEAFSEAVRAVEIPMKAQVEIAVANLPLAKAIASDGFRVALSGEAADELFGGYGNMIKAAHRSDDDGYRQVKRDVLAKMARGNFCRVNKVFMAAGVEARLPFMHRPLVEMAVDASKAESPPGKKLLAQAAKDDVPSWVVKRQKETFQGGTGTAAVAAEMFPSPIKFYNSEARKAFGWLPHR